MSLEIALKQNILVKGSNLLKYTASCVRIWFADIHLWIQHGRQNICSVDEKNEL
jgi:hypothetical protein